MDVIHLMQETLNCIMNIEENKEEDVLRDILLVNIELLETIISS